MNKPAVVINFISHKKIICSAHDWKNMDREKAIQKECAARRKQKGLDPIAHRNIWKHINILTNELEGENKWQK